MSDHIVTSTIAQRNFQNTHNKIENARNSLNNNHKTKISSNMLHIVIFNNTNFNDNKIRDKVKNTINLLIKRYFGEHIILLSYGDEIKQITPILVLESEINEPIATLLELSLNYDFLNRVDDVEIKNYVQSHFQNYKNKYTLFITN